MTMQARTLEDCDRLFGEYVNSGEVEGVVALYEEDGCFVQRDGSAATGRSEIRKVITRLVEIRPALRSDVVRVMRAGENLAVLYNDWNLSADEKSHVPSAWRRTISMALPYARG